jgi:anti-sigma-K factor RskA
MTDDLHHLAAAYTVHALEPGELEAFEAHFPACETCAREVAELQATAAVLASAVAVTPPAELKASVLAQVASTPQAAPFTERPASDLQALNGIRPSAGQRWRPPLLAVAAAIAVFAGAAGGLLLAVAASGDDRVDELIAAPDAIRTELVGDAAGDMEVVWSPAQQEAAVIGSGVAEPGANQTYALWAGVGDGVVPAGLFNAAGGEVRTVVDLDDLGDLEANGWGVTIEPEGGSPQPTTEILFFGTR